ncbi:MAG: phosphotransferase [Bacilli bacterium]
MVSERLRSQVLQVFKVDIRAGRTVKSGVYHLVDVRNRQYCLKRMAYSKERLRWTERALGIVRERGFKRFSWGPLARLPGRETFYVLTPWLTGESPSLSDCAALADCAAVLAKFHRAGRTRRIVQASAHQELGRWPRFFQSGRELLKQALAGSGPFGHSRGLCAALLPYEDELLTRIHEARQRLATADYTSLVLAARETGSLCHGDSGPGNFVITKSGPQLIDFETLRIDLPVYDLFRMVRLTGKGTDWDFQFTRAILDGYRRVSPLGQADCDLLAVWILFPYKAVKILRRAARTPLHERSAAALKLERVLRQEAQVHQWATELDQYAQGLR